MLGDGLDGGGVEGVLVRVPALEHGPRDELVRGRDGAPQRDRPQARRLGLKSERERARQPREASRVSDEARGEARCFERGPGH